MVKGKQQESNKYTERGFENREDYLDVMAEEYGVDSDVATCLGDLLGESEDFDGLLSSLADAEACGL